MDSLAQLQEEKNKKFALLKMKKTGTNMEKSSAANPPLFGVSDDLNLSLSDTSSSAVVGLSTTLEAANTTMREEIRELKDETGRFRKALAEREYEIKLLKKKMMKCEEEKRLLSEAGLATDSASTKIVELSKKNRELTSQMESEKSKNIRLQQKINEYDKKLMQGSYHVEEDAGSTRNYNSSFSHRQTSVDMVESLQDQLNSANMKISEYRNQIQVLKQDMKIALKVLSQETGEDYATIQALVNNNAQGFRGRAQQVIALQDKVKELEQKLKTDLDLNPRIDKNAMRIKTMERSRKEQYDILKESFSSLQEQYAEVQRKWEASKARNKVLTSEVKTLKSQITVLAEKGSHDNELIETLMKQQENLHKLLERYSGAQEPAKRELVVINKELNDRQQQESAEIAKMKQQLAERELKINELEDQIISTADSLDNNRRPLSVFNSSAKKCSPTNSILLSSDENSVTLRKKCVELKALYDAAEIEKFQLSQLVSSITKRNDELTRQYEQILSKYNEIKRRCLYLEQKLDGIKGTEKSVTARESNRNQVGDLEAQLLIQKDENNALKEALETTIRSKQNDVSMYQEMNLQTKQVFLDALKALNVTQ